MSLTALGYLTGLLTAFGAGFGAAERAGRGAASFGWDRRGAGFLVMIGITGGIAVAGVTLLGMSVAGPRIDFQAVEGLTWNWLAAASVTLVLKALLVALEETVYRALVPICLVRRVGIVPAVVASALLFALTHLATENDLTPASVVYLFSAGLVWGALTRRTGSVWLAAGWHLAQNVWVWLLFGWGFSLAEAPARLILLGTSDLWGGQGQAGWIDSLLTLAAGGVLLLFLRDWSRRRTDAVETEI